MKINRISHIKIHDENQNIINSSLQGNSKISNKSSIKNKQSNKNDIILDYLPNENFNINVNKATLNDYTKFHTNNNEKGMRIYKKEGNNEVNTIHAALNKYSIEDGKTHKRNILKNKRFFDEDHIYLDPSIKKIKMLKNCIDTINTVSNSINKSNIKDYNSTCNFSNAKRGFSKIKKIKSFKNSKNHKNNNQNNPIINKNANFKIKSKYSKRRINDSHSPIKKNTSLVNNGTKIFYKVLTNHQKNYDELKANVKEINLYNFENLIQDNNNKIQLYNERFYPFYNTQQKRNNNYCIERVEKSDISDSNSSNECKGNFYNDWNALNLSLNEKKKKNKNNSTKRKKFQSFGNNKNPIGSYLNKNNNKNSTYLSLKDSPYGLKEISKNVIEILHKCKTTTYKDISDVIIKDIRRGFTRAKDEKNVRRRIYDSLNVMRALNIFKRDKNFKNIITNETCKNAIILKMLDNDSTKSDYSPEQQLDDNYNYKNNFLVDNYYNDIKSPFNTSEIDYKLKTNYDEIDHFNNLNDNINNKVSMSINQDCRENKVINESIINKFENLTDGSILNTKILDKNNLSYLENTKNLYNYNNIIFNQINFKPKNISNNIIFINILIVALKIVKH